MSCLEESLESEAGQAESDEQIAWYSTRRLRDANVTGGHRKFKTPRDVASSCWVT
jgi:hypothetical protein